MAKWSITELSSVTSFDRIDGEYYLPEYLENQLKLSKINTVALPQWFFVSDGNHLSVSKHFCETGEVPYFRGQDVNDFFLENADPIRIPRKIYESPMMKRSHFLNEDVLLSIVGTIGSLSFVSDEIGEATGSCKIAILRSKGEPSPYFLAAFLMSKYGQLQIKRNTRGAVQMGLILKDFSRLRIPILSEIEQSEIETIIKRAIKQNYRSKEKYKQAKTLIESELGLKKLRLKKKVGYTAQLSELGQSRRVDAEFFQPKYQSIIELIRKKSNATLGSLFHISRGICLNPNLYNGTEGVPYIRIKELSLSQPLDPINSVKIPPQFVSGKFLTATNGDYILAVIGATIGKINLIDELMQGSLFSNNTARLSLKVPLQYPNAMEFILRSPIVQQQIQQRMAKTAQEKITDSELKRILIPCLDSALMRDLEKMCLDSKNNYFASKKLLEQAKNRVEDLIEQAEEGSGEKS
jgi:hypothetical protein